MSTRMTAIDFDVHKVIEAARKSFEETDNDVLRRLLGLGAAASPQLATATQSGRAWASKGVTLPDGTELRMEYRGIEHHGKIQDGKWLCGGAFHAGPSPAAAAVATTRQGKKPSLNGWIYWQAKLPGSANWVSIENMRKGKQ